MNDSRYYRIYAVILSLLAICIIAAVILKIAAKLPYKSADSLLTNAEKNFFNVLLSIDFNFNIYIFSKVRLADVIYLPNGIKNRRKYLSKILSKHLDFVICNGQTYKPILVIELDDSSHNNIENRKRDIEKNNILKAANIPILRIKVQRHYDISEIKKSVEQLIKHKRSV
jgi:very-short-patch-repair endonuclease